MNEIDNLIDEIHAAQAEKRLSEHTAVPRQGHRPVWPYAVAASALAGLALGIALWHREAPAAERPYVARVETPAPAQTVQRVQGVHRVHEALPLQDGGSASVAPSAKERFAHSSSSDGIEVYCENQCDADEVIAHLENTLATLIQPS